MHNVDVDNYYYVQAFFVQVDGSEYINPIYFIVFADNKKEAEIKAAQYCEEMYTDKVKEIVYYHKNYIKDSRALVAEGKCC